MKKRIFCDFPKSIFFGQERLFFFQDIRQTLFLALFCLKTEFCLKPWSNPFGKMHIFEQNLRRFFDYFYLDSHQTIHLFLF